MGRPIHSDTQTNYMVDCIRECLGLAPLFRGDNPTMEERFYRVQPERVEDGRVWTSVGSEGKVFVAFPGENEHG